MSKWNDPRHANRWEAPRNDEEREVWSDFEAHFERLSAKTGRALAAQVQEAAWLQVLLYVRKLGAFARRVTETEVRLLLPNRQTPAGRRYTMEGIVDIVDNGTERLMYDIKTYLASNEYTHSEVVANQLAMYAHLFEQARGQLPTGLGIVATKPPASLDEAISQTIPQSSSNIEDELAAWDPIVSVEMNASLLATVEAQFSNIVDRIEGGDFDPASQEQLKKSAPGARSSLAVDTCRNCGGRWGCPSYRAYRGWLPVSQFVPLSPTAIDDDEYDENESALETALDALDG